MIRFLLTTTVVLLLGSIGAFYLFVSPLSIAAVVTILVAVLLVFALGIGIATEDTVHDEWKKGQDDEE